MKQVIVLFVIVLIFTQCSMTRVFNTDTATDAIPTTYKTYGFYEFTAAGDTSSATFQLRVEILKNAIKAEMNMRGYQFVSTRPDLLINIGILIKRQIQIRQTNWQNDGQFTYMGQRNYTWKSEEVEVGRYKEGTLTLHIVEAARNKIIWQGSMSGVVPDKPDTKSNAAGKAMKKLFEKYPFRAGVGM